MRTRLTNILQVIVLIAGIIYILIGVVFYYSPINFFKFFSVEVPDDWFKSIEYDTFVAPLYILIKGFSAMIFTSGMSMILPLYDPLRYRGLIYYMGIIFPLFSGVMLLYSGFKLDHLILTSLGAVFFFILLSTAIALIITRKEAKAGIE
ncbi:MAG: hypothetical protein JXN64_00585 [Spirochaetes bacterium]|nr:hypothetical protein [Spirochaetota bacterium]